MRIYVGSGVGIGRTKMAAFDAALQKIGIANYNQIRLSSIIPPDTTVVDKEGKIPVAVPGAWGDRLYVVMAEIQVDTPGKSAWAGIGWTQENETGKGFFTEHVGDSEAFVRWEIDQTLLALVESRNMSCGPIQSLVIGGECHGKPICAMVAAVYQVSGWENESYLLKSDS